MHSAGVRAKGKECQKEVVFEMCCLMKCEGDLF